MNEPTKLQSVEEEHVYQKKLTNLDLLQDPSCPNVNKNNKPAMEDENEKNNFPRERNLSNSETTENSVDKGTPLSESHDDSLITLNSFKSETEENRSKVKEQETKKDNEITKNTEDEDEGTYEELICLVRQFYVEKPINPAALAHQNIETC